MGFQFPLATLLRVRAIREENEERVLLQIGAEIARTLELQADVALALERISAKQSTNAGVAFKGSDVHTHYAELHGLWQSREELHLHLQRLEELKQKQMSIYTTARQNREMLTDLNDTHRAAHDADLAKREQKAIDDNFIARRKSG